MSLQDGMRNSRILTSTLAAIWILFKYSGLSASPLDGLVWRNSHQDASGFWFANSNSTKLRDAAFAFEVLNRDRDSSMSSVLNRAQLAIQSTMTTSTDYLSRQLSIRAAALSISDTLLDTLRASQNAAGWP